MMFLEFSVLKGFSDKIIHGMTTRSFGSFNTDVPGFEKQFKKLSESIKCDTVFAKQVHGDEIVIISGKQPKGPFACDAFITDKKGTALVIKVADCQGIFLFDPVTSVIAAVHAGWKGVAVNIAGKTVRKMAEAFKVDPKNLLAAISPSIGPCCCEFSDPAKELPAFMKPYIKGEHVDLWSATKDHLKNAGLTENHIQISGECTKCNSDKYFSFRNKDVGRMAVFIGLK
jgi:polyphenol oxidase